LANLKLLSTNYVEIPIPEFVPLPRIGMYELASDGITGLWCCRHQEEKVVGSNPRPGIVLLVSTEIFCVE
jgi:hypothetical protein